MAEIVLFHPGLGRRPFVLAGADRLRAAGHEVHTPDLFDGRVFDDRDAALRNMHEIGIPELIRRAREAVAELPPTIVFAGFSIGAGMAELLAATRAGARGAVLMSGALAPAQLDLSAWPPEVPLTLHFAEGDPVVEAEAVAALEMLVSGAGADFEPHTYPGSAHLFADPEPPDPYDAESAEQMWERVLDFLARVDARAAA